MKKCYFLCATQPFNLGDLVINKMLVSELANHSTVYVDCYNVPANFSGELIKGDNIVDFANSYNCSLKSFSALKALFLIKKQNISSAFLTPGPSALKFNLPDIIILIEIAILRLLGINVYRIGNDFSEKNDNRILRAVSNLLITKYYLRSYSVVNILNDYRRDIASYIPDLSLLLTETKKEKKRNKVAVTFRSAAGDNNEFKESCIKQINYLLSQGLEVCFYYQVKTDRDFVFSLYKEFEGVSSVSFKKDILWYSDIHFYDDKLYVFSNRLHSLLLGTVNTSIPIAYVGSSNKKIARVFKSLFPDNDYKYIYNCNQNICVSDFNVDNEQDYIYKTMIQNKQLIQETIKTLFE